MNDKLKVINSEFKKNGYLYRLTKRKGNVTLVTVFSKRGLEINGYEVHLIRTRQYRQSPYSTTPTPVNWEREEYYPSNNDFGKYGWYYETKEKAEQCFNEKIMLKLKAGVSK